MSEDNMRTTVLPDNAFPDNFNGHPWEEMQAHVQKHPQPMGNMPNPELQPTMSDDSMPTTALPDSFNDITEEGTQAYAKMYQQRMGYAANQSMREPDPTRRPLTEEDMRQEDHDITPDYEIGDRLGRGGCAVVYEGWRLSDRFHVAIKQLAIPATSDHEEEYIARKRFYREAKLIASLHEKHIVQCVDYGVMGEHQPCMVLEYIKGRELGDYMQDPETWKDASSGENYLSIEKSVDITLQVLEALRASHAKTIIHRDIKPGNIMVLDDSPKDKPIIKVLDFGIATVIDSVDNSNTLMTQAGNIRGTPSYMSPELFTGAARASVDSDLYAVGLVLLECLTNRVAFEGASFMQVAYMQVNEEPEIPIYIPECLAAIIRKATAKKKEDRYQSADDMIRDLRNSLASAVEAYPKCRTTFLNQKAPSPWLLFLKSHKKNILSIAAIIALVIVVTVLTQVVFAPKTDEKLVEQTQEAVAALEIAKAQNTKLTQEVEQAKQEVVKTKSLLPDIQNLPGSEKFEEQLQNYCKNAAGCNVFADIDACKNKYLDYFKTDSNDCKKVHLDALTIELKAVDILYKQKSCDYIKSFESCTRIEEVYNNSKTSNEMAAKLQQLVPRMDYHQTQLSTDLYQSNLTECRDTSSECYTIIKDNGTAWGKYMTCRTMMLATQEMMNNQ